MSGGVHVGRVPKEKPARVTYLIATEMRQVEQDRLEQRLKRVEGESYWVTPLAGNRVRIEMIVPTRQELQEVPVDGS